MSDLNSPIVIKESDAFSHICAHNFNICRHTTSISWILKQKRHHNFSLKFINRFTNNIRESTFACVSSFDKCAQVMINTRKVDDIVVKLWIFIMSWLVGCLEADPMW